MKINLGTVDRAVRGVVGVILLVVGTILVRGVVGIALDVVGVVLLFSSFVGFCHVYKIFHIDSSKTHWDRSRWLRSRSDSSPPFARLPR